MLVSGTSNNPFLAPGGSGAPVAKGRAVFFGEDNSGGWRSVGVRDTSPLIQFERVFSPVATVDFERRNCVGDQFQRTADSIHGPEVYIPRANGRKIMKHV